MSLKPYQCPFPNCGGTTTIVCVYPEEGDLEEYRVLCNRCGASGPRRETGLWAITDWDKVAMTIASIPNPLR